MSSVPTSGSSPPSNFTFWETPDGTPAHLRGRGYAGAVTVEVSRAALTASATDVVLFTDPDNPTGNALYQRIGYVHVADFAGYEFSYGGAHADQPA